jgi:Putative MetA-pathway of phenol degradation
MLSVTTRHARAVLAALPVLCIGACATGAYRTALTGPDRPGYSFGTATVPLGGAQLEVGYTDTRSDNVTYQTLGEGLLRVGVGANTELRLFTNSYALRDDASIGTHGVEDAKIGFKQRFRAGTGTTGLAATSLSLLAGTSLPTGSDGFGVDAWQPEAIIAAALPVTPKLSLVPNVGDVYAMIGDTRQHRALGTLAAWYTLSSKLSAFAEYGGSQLTNDARSRLQYLDGGFALVPLPALQLDIRAGHGMNGIPADNFIGLGLSRRW